MGVWYTTREAVKSALDFNETARNNAQVDRAIEAASRGVEGFLHRRFYPQVDTRYFDWPNHQTARSWRLWLDSDEVISVTTLTVAGQTIPDSDYFLEPANDGPPYTRIEMDLESSASFSSGATHQRAVAITGVFGYQDVTISAGALAEALDATETSVEVTDSASVGVGSILNVGDERMLVTGKTMLDSGQDLEGNLTASAANDTVPVATGAGYVVGEAVLIDAERMLVVDIAGNNLIVKRGWDGSTLAAHSAGADIYVARALTIERGALGTTAGAHDSGATVWVQVIPFLVQELTIAEAINLLLQANSGYARVAGSGDNAREYAGRALQQLREMAMSTHGRRSRTGTV
jgi:hypothetical protein